ncbi:OPT family oligopeptide transporter [candidate division KSB1 bacterium]|nr:MAG: OPT family oligopeptide transporter [candidate division KSB1 bacterium]
MADDATKVEKTVEERDREWLETVYKGDDVPQLTARAVIAGMLFGGLMSLSNLYIGLKSGWGLGVDIAAVIVIFALFKALKGVGIVKKDFGMMENTIMMTVAVAASWISSAGLVSAVPALTMLTGYTFIWWQLTLFIGVILFLGLFMAIPFKRQMIQVDHLRFPAVIPTGETLKAMYSHGGEAMKKAKALGISGGLGVLIAMVRDGLPAIRGLNGLTIIPGLMDAPIRILRIPLSKLTLSFEPSLIFIGIGALFGIKVGLSMLFGLLLNYGVLAPNLIQSGIIKHPAPQVRAVELPKTPLAIQPGQTFTVVLEEANKGPELTDGSATRTLTYTWLQPTVYGGTEQLIRDLNAPTLVNGSPNPFFGVVSIRDTMNKSLGAKVLFVEASKAVTWEAQLSIPEDQPTELVTAFGFTPGASRLQTVGGFRNVSAWSLWPGATILVVGGLLGLAFQWRTLGRTFGSIFRSFSNNKAKAGALDHLEIPMTWFITGFVIFGFAAAIMLLWMFSIKWYIGLIAVILTFFLAAVAARASAEIGINPIGAMGKVTQLTYGVITPGNVSANLMAAGVTAGAACSCADTIANLKVGNMVGANPRKQFIAQMFGVLAGAMLAVPAYFILVPDANALGGAQFPAPSALVWMGVAKVLSQGLGSLPPSAVLAMAIACLFGMLIVIVDKVFPKLRPYTPSPAALGIALTIPAYTSFGMFLGALIAWILEKKAAKWNDLFTIPIASGCIAGESITGVILATLLAAGVIG